MANYVFLFVGGWMPEGEDDREKVMAEWRKWFEEMGDAVVDPGGPLGQAAGVSSGGGEAADVNGYTVVKADGIEAAKGLAKNSPHLDAGGTVSVHEILEIM